MLGRRVREERMSGREDVRGEREGRWPTLSSVHVWALAGASHDSPRTPSVHISGPTSNTTEVPPPKRGRKG